MQHLDEGTIHAWLDDALPADASRDVEQHVAECAECAALVAEARGMIAGASRIVSSLDVVRGGVIPKQTKPAAAASGSLWRSLHLTPMRAALAASLMIAAATLLTVRHDTVDKMVPAAPPASSPAPSASAQSAPASRVADAEADRGSQPRRDAPQPSQAKLKERPAAANEVQRVVAAADERRRASDSTTASAAQKPDVANVATTGLVAQKAAAAPPSAPAAGAVAGGGAKRLEASADLAKVSTDSVRALDRMAASRAFAPRAAERTDQLMAMRREVRPAFIACYQLASSVASDAAPATDAASAALLVPVRFALDQLGADSATRVVRSVTPEGRVDSVLTGSRWTQPSLNVFVVRFAQADNAQELTMRLVAGGASGVANTGVGSRSRTLRVSRVDCRP